MFKSVAHQSNSTAGPPKTSRSGSVNFGHKPKQSYFSFWRLLATTSIRAQGFDNSFERGFEFGVVSVPTLKVSRQPAVQFAFLSALELLAEQMTVQIQRDKREDFFV
ncbi:MAG TPA: hypothetical protein VNT99_10830, partial [Methylomirabilota bacterium]|nr:hypothetical protein [Methylomirabilota bacterium]